jgi:ABC-type transport system involved in cytochrome bd biosynthesis fused ATPase/permease subunit
MNLEIAAASLVDQFGGERDDIKLSEQKLEQFGKFTFTGLGFVIGIGIIALIYWIVSQMIIGSAQPLVGILLIAFIVFAALSLGYVAWAEYLKEKKERLAKNTASQNKTVTRLPETARLLNDPIIEPVPSVVEDTTELLRVPRSREGPERE